MSTTKSQFDSVVEFMTVAGQKVNTIFTEPTTKVGNFRLSLINEEMKGPNELFDSIQKDNLEKILDGICDVLYVAYGAYATFGLEPLDYAIPSQRNIPSTLLTMSEAHVLMRYVSDGYEQLSRGLISGDMRTIQTGLNNIVFNTLTIAHSHNFNVVGAFDEVHKSNMSKFCTTYNNAIDDIAARKGEGKEDYIDATVSEVVHNGKSFFIINRAADGKVLKGLNFFEPDLTKFIKA